jgi:rhodanese-related sulfurtransferase
MKKLILLAAALMLTVAAHANKVPDITLTELKTAIAEKKVTLLDVNGTSSWQSGHIPGAIDFKGNAAKLASLLPKDKNALVVAYCGSPRCSAYQAAAKAAQELGYTNVKHYSGGIAGWKEAGEKTDKSS